MKQKIGRPKNYETAEQLRRAVERYFASITYEQDVVIYRPEIREKNGEDVLVKVPEYLLDKSGEPVKETVWLEEPSIEALCLHLGISDTTWGNYMKDEVLGPVAQAAKANIRARLVQLLTIRNSTHGIEFNLQNNYDFKQKVEHSSAEGFRIELGPGMEEYAR